MARFTRTTLTGLTAAAAVLAGTMAATGPAAQADSPSGTAAQRWLKPKVMPLDRTDGFSSVASSGWGNIWASGMATVDGNDGVVPIWHWNGKKWGRVVSPKKVDDRVTDLSTGATGNTWILGSGDSGLYRRSGTAWKSAGAHGNDVTAIGAVGGRQLFAAAPGAMRHYDGSTWRTYAMPKKATVSTIRTGSPTNAWAIGKIKTGDHVSQPFTAHWDGKAWKRVPAPSVGSGSDGNLVDVTDLAFIGKNEAFASGMVMTSETDYQTLLLHWNGKKWARVAAPQQAETGLDDLAADGRGGLWAITDDVKGVLHRSASGTWKRYDLPGGQQAHASALTRIPGTKRAIAAGDVTTAQSAQKPAVMLTN